MERIQLFKLSDMPNRMGEIDTNRIIYGNGGNCTDSYSKWCPNHKEQDRPYNYFIVKDNIEARILLNQWLVEHGMEWDKELKDFYVIIQMW